MGTKDDERAGGGSSRRYFGAVETKIRSGTPGFRFAADALLILLPLQAGLERFGRVLGVPTWMIWVVRTVKELLIAGLVVTFAYLLASGTLRLRVQYLGAALIWAILLLYVAVCAVLDGPSLTTLYGFRVYAEPVLAGVALGALLKHAGAERRLLLWLAVMGIVVFAFAAIQALFPFSSVFAALRETTVDRFGELPPALSVGIINQLRPFATFSDPNDLGLFGVLVLLSTIGFPAQTRVMLRLQRVARWAAIGGIAITFSRSALLAAVVGLAAIMGTELLFRPELMARVSWTRCVKFSLLIVSVMVVSVWIGREVPQLQHIANALSGADPSTRGHLSSLVDGFWKTVEAPGGIGLGVVGPRAGLYGANAKQYHVESSFLQIAIELGAPGLLLYLSGWLAAIGAGLADSSRRRRNNGDADWGRFLVSVLSAQIVAYFFLPTIVSLQTGAIVWSVLGVSLASHRSAVSAEGLRDPMVATAPS
jgi:hypothetical protein